MLDIYEVRNRSFVASRECHLSNCLDISQAQSLRCLPADEATVAHVTSQQHLLFRHLFNRPEHVGDT